MNNLILVAAPGAEQPIPLGEIKEATCSNVSLMPQVFDGLLRPEEITDLTACLSQAK
ncbi:MAG: hypothetical protein HC814_02150 [Rhodobacteraceae bacterium]|nr:hypothetical protein [Paracoccaceae bacterium]